MKFHRDAHGRIVADQREQVGETVASQCGDGCGVNFVRTRARDRLPCARSRTRRVRVPWRAPERLRRRKASITAGGCPAFSAPRRCASYTNGLAKRRATTTTAISSSRSLSDEPLLRYVPSASMRSASRGLCSQILNGLGKNPRPCCTASSTASCTRVNFSGAISSRRDGPSFSGMSIEVWPLPREGHAPSAGGTWYHAVITYFVPAVTGSARCSSTGEKTTTAPASGDSARSGSANVVAPPVKSSFR